MTTRTATCRCGQLSASCNGGPVRVSVCHCRNCQRRSGSAFAFQARFAPENVTIAGEHRTWTSIGDDGKATDFHFCPTCGATLFYINGNLPDLVAIAVGAFADPAFPAPHYSVFEQRKHGWLEIIGEGIEHFS